MEISIKLLDIIFSGLKYALDAKHEFVTPEHLLKAALDSEEVKQLIDECNGNLQDIQKNTESYLSKNVFALENVEPVPTLGFQSLLEQTVLHSIAVERKYICLRDFIVSLYDAEKIQAGFILKKAGISRLSLLDSVDILTDDFFIPVDEIPAKEFPYIKEAFTVPPFIEELMKNLADEENSEVLEEFSKEIDTSDESKLQSFLQFLDNSEEQDEKKQKKNKDSKKKFLDHFTKDLIQACQKGEVDPILYRDNEINQTFEILLRRVKNNALHVGDAGVGKTAILMGIAEAIFTGKCPDFFKDFSVYSLDIGALIAGTRYRGDFEERFKKLIEELSQKEKVILVIDEIHTIVGAGNGQEGLDIANLLKPILSEGKIRIVGSTTFEDYKKTIAKNNALARRFQKIDIAELSPEKTENVLQGLMPLYEKHHSVLYSPEIIHQAVSLSVHYLPELKLPDKALDILDQAGAYTQLYRKKKAKKPLPVTSETIEIIVSRMSSVPQKSLKQDETTQLEKLEHNLKEHIFGQDTAINLVTKAIKRSRAGFRAKEKPIANFLFVGPTGVGKTELAKELASQLHMPLIRFDMSEYQEKHTVSRLIGSPPGYVGFEEGGLLTDAIRKTPSAILLLDEIEKAHQDIYNILLQIMDYASLTDTQGKKADFRNVLLIMTSNAGAVNLNKALIGFGDTKDTTFALKEAVEKQFTPEFRNRLDHIVPFNQLTMDITENIVKNEIAKLSALVAEKNIVIKADKKCIRHLAQIGYSQEFGARNIARTIEEKIASPLVDQVLFGNLKNGGTVKCSYNSAQKEIIFTYE